MLTNPTIDMLRDLGLSGMASAYQELDTQPEVRHLEHGEWLALLLEREATARRQKRFEARARAANLAMMPNLRTLTSEPPAASIAISS
jgi:hypothetical protein